MKSLIRILGVLAAFALLTVLTMEDMIPESRLPADLRVETLADLAKAVWAYEKS